MALNFDLLKDSVSKCIEWMLANNLCLTEPIDNYYSCQEVFNAICYLLTNDKKHLGIEDDNDRDSADDNTMPHDIINDEYSTGEFKIINDKLVLYDDQDKFCDLIFDTKKMYIFKVSGVNITNYGEGEPTNLFSQILDPPLQKLFASVKVEHSSTDHCFVYIFLDDAWYIMDSFMPFRKLEKYPVDIDQLKKFISENEVKLDIDQYNKFFNVNITNYDAVTNLDCWMGSIKKWNSDNILPALNALV